MTIEDARSVPNNDKARLERDLQKWKGLRKENLDKHNVEQNQDYIRDENESFEITGETCSLCQAYNAPFSLMYKYKCKECPLYKVHDTRCDKTIYGRNPYFDFIVDGNPENMIQLIEKALENENTGN